MPGNDLEILAFRETGHTPLNLDPSTIEVLTGDVSLRDADVLYYAGGEPRLPSEEHPIVQSYVDVCVGGCLEIQEQFPTRRTTSFARSFIQTTDAWQPPWVNDRLLPWRPSVHEPRAWEFDALLREVLGAEMFGQIGIPRF